MSMPNTLVLVRHGQSEANIVHEAESEGRAIDIPVGFYGRHDWEYRLSDLGIEQAKIAGSWLLDNIGDPMEVFDRRYTSPFMRARETAAHIGGPATTWLVDERLKERSWGSYGATPKEERERLYGTTLRLREQSNWYTQLDGGESLAHGVFTRLRDVFDTLHRDVSDRSALIVSHGDTIKTSMNIAEHMLPEEWEEADKDESRDIGNCTIVWYSRINPINHLDIRPHLKWRRMVYPDNLAASPFGGEWVELPGKRWFTGEQLLAQVALKPVLTASLEASLQEDQD